jgi:long-chain acyl-CoA synthetase
MSLNLAVILRESALKNPGKTALILDSFRMSYGELDVATDTVAASLAARGVSRGQSVGLMLPNVPEFVIAYFGLLKAGAVVVPMNPLLKAPEVAHYLGDSDARTLITWEGSAAEALRGAAEVGDVQSYVVGRPGAEPPQGARGFGELLQGGAAYDMEPTDADDTAVLLYTSGTTGRPKGAELTHFNLFMNCHIVGMLFGVREDDVVLGMLPLFHAFGQSSVMNVVIHFGGTLTLLPRFEPAKALEVIQRERVTVFSGVPTMFFAMLNFPELDRYDISSLRVSSSGGASLPGEVLDAFEERFGISILEGYGLSETSPTATFNRSVEERKVYSIGKPIWGVEARIFDENDRELPRGKDSVGEIVLRGHNVMKGYYKNPEATAEALKGGWFHTGDLGYRDEDGFFFIVDRKKELIIRGGFNVYPREVEEVLYSHPAVVEAAVIGVPDERLGEEVMAVVALKPGQQATEEEIVGFCKERVAAYKYPRSVRFLDELPKGATGKIAKKELKAMLVEARA